MGLGNLQDGECLSVSHLLLGKKVETGLIIHIADIIKSPQKSVQEVVQGVNEFLNTIMHKGSCI